MNKLIIGTRKSKLALWQSNHVRSLLLRIFSHLEIELKPIVTSGDKLHGAPLPEIGGKGLFTAELEEALLNGSIHLAVHSLKDLPTEINPKLTIAAIPKRAAVADVLVSRGHIKFNELPNGGLVGTSSLRRSSQLLSLRPDLRYEPLRGNIDSRIRKVMEPAGEYAACVLAKAGLVRLGMDANISQVFSEEELLPAPGQGALAVQCSSTANEVLQIASALECSDTRAETDAERAFLNKLEAGCRAPVAARALVLDGEIKFSGRAVSLDGKKRIDVSGVSPFEEATRLGIKMADEALSQGFKGLVA